MTIDWNGKLTCTSGPVVVLEVSKSAEFIAVECCGLRFDVHADTGQPVKNAMMIVDRCTVRNVKGVREKAIEAIDGHIHDLTGNAPRITNIPFKEVVDVLIEGGFIKEDE